MLNEIFRAFLVTSLAGTVLAAFVTLLRPLTRRIFNCSWNYYIWLAVLFVMLLPVRFALPQNQAELPVIKTQAVQTENVESAEQTGQTEIENDTANIHLLKPATAQKITDMFSRFMNRGQKNLGIIWLAGIVASLLVNIGGYIRLIAQIRKNSVLAACPEVRNYTDKSITVRIDRHISSPFMIGILRPTLVLPDRELDGEQLNNVLRHEMTHFKRRDLLYKWFAILVRCIHWFNPAAYYIARQINTECEISCDLSVTGRMNDRERLSYINTILSLASGSRMKTVPLRTQMASGKKALKRRFTMIKNLRRVSKAASFVSVITAAVMLATTVFASGVFSDLTTDAYTVEFTMDGKKIAFVNKPFVENGEVYVPLRETLEKTGIMAHEDSHINWDNGYIELCLAYIEDSEDAIEMHKQLKVDQITVVYDYAIRIGQRALILNPVPNLVGQTVSFEKEMSNAPILRGSITYVPLSYADYMLRSHEFKAITLDYSILDRDGNTIYENSPGVDTVFISEE